jgi:Xaa-Pro aminopeptidase
MAVDWQQRVNFDKLRQDRIDRANQFLHKYGIGSAIIYEWDGQRYLSSGWNHPYSRHHPAHFNFFVRDAGFPYVHVDPNLDEAQVRVTAPWLNDHLVTDEELSQPSVLQWDSEENKVKNWAKTAKQIKTLMTKHGVVDLPVSIDYAGMHIVKALQDEGLEVVDGNNWIHEARMVKTDEEIELLRQAAEIDEAGYAAVCKVLRPGMRENDVQGVMAKAMYEAGMEYQEGWVVASGLRTAPRNFNWSDRMIRPGELMTLEACHVTFCGYKVCYDRTFLIGGKPNEPQQEVYDICVDMNQRAIKLLKPGITTHDVVKTRPHPFPMPSPVFKTAEDIRKYRTGWSNHFGGMGISHNEEPNFMGCLTRPPITLEKNMVIAYSALYWVEGYQGALIENTVRLTDTGNEVLTKWPWEDLIICPPGY